MSKTLSREEYDNCMRNRGNSSNLELDINSIIRDCEQLLTPDNESVDGYADADSASAAAAVFTASKPSRSHGKSTFTPSDWISASLPYLLTFFIILTGVALGVSFVPFFLNSSVAWLALFTNKIIIFSLAVFSIVSWTAIYGADIPEIKKKLNFERFFKKDRSFLKNLDNKNLKTNAIEILHTIKEAIENYKYDAGLKIAILKLESQGLFYDDVMIHLIDIRRKLKNYNMNYTIIDYLAVQIKPRNKDISDLSGKHETKYDKDRNVEVYQKHKGKINFIANIFNIIGYINAIFVNSVGVFISALGFTAFCFSFFSSATVLPAVLSLTFALFFLIAGFCAAFCLTRKRTQKAGENIAVSFLKGYESLNQTTAIKKLYNSGLFITKITCFILFILVCSQCVHNLPALAFVVFASASFACIAMRISKIKITKFSELFGTDSTLVFSLIAVLIIAIGFAGFNYYTGYYFGSMLSHLLATVFHLSIHNHSIHFVFHFGLKNIYKIHSLVLIKEILNGSFATTVLGRIFAQTGLYLTVISTSAFLFPVVNGWFKQLATLFPEEYIERNENGSKQIYITFMPSLVYFMITFTLTVFLSCFLSMPIALAVTFSGIFLCETLYYCKDSEFVDDLKHLAKEKINVKNAVGSLPVLVKMLLAVVLSFLTAVMIMLLLQQPNSFWYLNVTQNMAILKTVSVVVFTAAMFCFPAVFFGGFTEVQNMMFNSNPVPTGEFGKDQIASKNFKQNSKGLKNTGLRLGGGGGGGESLKL